MTQSARYVLDAISAQAFARLEAEAHEAATSPWNHRKHPTLAQMLAVNWKHGQFDLRPGLRVKIENPRGTIRSGKTPDGIPWENRMAAHYGDIVGTRGADGDPVDIFIGPFPESESMWVINQRQNWDGATGFDEHKVCAGFHTEEQARAAYLGSYQRGWNGLESIVPCTYAQLKWWLRNGDTSKPFTTDPIPQQGTSIMDKAVAWDADANPVGIPMHQLVYDLRRADAGENLLLDSVTMADLMTDPDIEGVVQLDALVVEVSRMSLKMEMLKRVMESAGTTVKPTEVTISDPVRARGVLQVMVLFQMTDGQAISVWFHNPDTTPAKLTPLDELISWKWMLNKKDVTIVVAPERGQELNVREVARRIMRLVERNSDTFKRANEKAAARVKQVEDLKSEITVLEVELGDWQRKIEIAQLERDEAPTPKERWDSARGHANAVDKSVREDVLNGPQVQNMEAFREITAMLQALRDLAGGTTQVEGPEELRAKVDELAVQIRAKLEEAAKAPAAPAQVAEAPAPAVTGSSDAALASLVTPEDIAGIRDDGGYAAVVADEKLALKWQDVLDSAWQQRLVDVRNALRELGWRDTEERGVIAKNGHKLVTVLKQVGAGANIVGAHYEIEGVPGFFMSDVLDRQAAEIADRINMGLPHEAPAPAGSPLDAFEAAGGEPWQVTRTRWVEIMTGHMQSLGQDSNPTEFRAFHEGAVKTALDSGKPVPAEVLADYPGMKAETSEEKEARYAKAEAALNTLIGKAAGETAPRKTSNVPGELTDAEKVVILASSAYKSAFRLKNAMYDAGISEAEYTEALNALNAQGYYLRRSALTAEGAAWIKSFDVPGAIGAVGKLATFKGKFAAAPAAEPNQKPEAAVTGSPTDAELQAAAEAGAEVNRIARNLADPSTKELPKATLSGGSAKTIFLYTDEDVGRAVRAVHDAEDMSNYRPFDPSDLRMPTATQLGLNQPAGPVLIVSNTDNTVVLDGWSNGHMIDLAGRPAVIQKALDKYVGDLSLVSNRARRVPMSAVEKIEAAAKGRSAKVEPIAHYDFEETSNTPGKPSQRIPRNSLVLESADGATWVWLDERYVAYFWKTYKGCEFFADGPDASVAVRHHGKLVGIIMPRATKGDQSILSRAKRVKAQAQAAGEPDALTPSVVDASYRFADATDAFKIAIAHSVGDTQYSAFLTARAMDERAKALGLDVSWDVQELVLDSASTPSLGLLDDAGEEPAGEVFQTCVGVIKRGGEVIGRAVVSDGDGKAMVYVGAEGKTRVQYVSGVDGARRDAMWSDDDAVDMIDWLVENLAHAQAQAEAATAEEEDDNIGRTWRSPEGVMEVVGFDEKTRRYKTQVNGEEAGPQIDPDDLEQYIRDDERRVAEVEAETIAAREPAPGQKPWLGAAKDPRIASVRKVAGTERTSYTTAGGGPGKVSDYRVEFKDGRFGATVYAVDRDYAAWQAIKDRNRKDGVAFPLYAEEQVAPEIDPAAAPAVSETAPAMNQLRPMQPQSDDRIQWEGEIARLLVAQEEVSNGDAQGMMESRPDDLDAAFAAGEAPAAVVGRLWAVQTAPKGDISYREVDDMFTSFYPDSKAGEAAWAVINATPGSENGKVLTTHAASVIEQLQAAGYTVTRSAPPTLSDDELLAELTAPAASAPTERKDFERKVAEAPSQFAVGLQGDTVPVSFQQRSMAQQRIDGLPADRRGDVRIVAAGDGAARRYWIVPTFEAYSSGRVVPASERSADPAPAALAADPAKDTDRAYLQTLIDGTADIFDEGILPRIEAMYEKYASDADMMTVLEQAANAWSNAAAEAAKAALTT